MQIDLKWVVLKPSLLSTLVMLVCVVLFVKLGFWQLSKGQAKQAIAEVYAASAKKQRMMLNTLALDNKNTLLALHTSKVFVKGHYDDRYQILLDNQVYQQQAGFHVLTPFIVAGTNMAILVNRGWVAGYTNHQQLPSIQTSSEMQEISGMAWLPSKKTFSLEHAEQWQVPGVWQQLDYDSYQSKTPLQLLPIILKLDASVKKEGFVRVWEPPVSKVVSHFGYAYQWFGFAIAAILIYFYNICVIKPKN